MSSGGQIQQQAAPPPPTTAATPQFISNGKYRTDGRCGADLLADDGVNVAECDPNSEYW